MSVRQKFGLGAFLTVNIWLIIIALVRISSTKTRNTIDTTWMIFFQFFEPNVAILAACFSAFRSLFVFNDSKRHARNNRATYSIRERLFRMSPADHQQLHDLPPVPRATLTGMRTVIWQKDRSKDGILCNQDMTSDQAIQEGVSVVTSLQRLDNDGSNIVVAKGRSVESATVRYLSEARANLIV